MIRVVETELHHMLEVKLQDASVNDLVYQQFQALPNRDEMLSQNSRSMMLDDRVIACFGVWPLWAGVGRAWALLSEEALANHAKSLHRAARDGLALIEDREGFRRIEATIRAGHEAGHRWARHLGFKRECLMRNYGPGGYGDQHLYARFP